MYDTSDPRAALAPASAASPASGPFADAQIGLFYATAPQITAPHSQTWLLRGSNFLVAYSQAQPGAMLGRTAQQDEYVVLLPDRDTRVEITTADGTQQVAGHHIVMVPPGDSTLRVVSGGPVCRIFSTQNADLAALCPNQAAFAHLPAHVAPLRPWPAPPGGFRLRAYSLDVPVEKSRFGRIFRCTNFMVNCLYGYDGPRDTTQLSPHHHDDFEQGSLALGGSFLHHLRWPWTTNQAHWREDSHIACDSPSLIVIPPPAIHTTQANGLGHNLLVDIFSPPRRDFSAKPGWVLNAADYPEA